MKKRSVIHKVLALFICINGHKSIGNASGWKKHKCPYCSSTAQQFGPVGIGTLDTEKPLLCKILAGEEF